VSFFVVAGTVKPIPVSPVELVDYLLVKLFIFKIFFFGKSISHNQASPINRRHFSFSNRHLKGVE